jgi:hypothetical protein
MKLLRKLAADKPLRRSPCRRPFKFPMNWPNRSAQTNASPQAFITVVVLELFREHPISVGKAAELLELSYREFLDLLQAKNIPVITAPPRDPQEVAALLHRAEGSV